MQSLETRLAWNAKRHERLGVDVVPPKQRYAVMRKIIAQHCVLFGETDNICIVSPGSARRGRNALYLRYGVRASDHQRIHSSDLVIVDQADYYSAAQKDVFANALGRVVMLFDSSEKALENWGYRVVERTLKWC
jgi:hypothetical protein